MMFNIQSLVILTTAATLISPTLAVFDASSNSNMAVYWGQGPYQKDLSYYCADPSIDIINIGFLNRFPDQTKGYPGTNFGNQCGDATFKNKDGSNSPLLSDCPKIGDDILTCQQAGKKVFLSLGGAIPSNQRIADDQSAQAFAQFLWTSFGPVSDLTAPRPFGGAVIDGFDFDIESIAVEGEDPKALSRGYSTLVNTLRRYYSLEKSKTFYISGAPQCIVPDEHLANAMETSYFDFIFVQFYNTPQCSARAFFDHTYGGPDSDISYAKWVDFLKNMVNKKAKIFVGLPGSPDKNVVYDPAMYLKPNEAKELIETLQREYPDAFGGVMIYEATASDNNKVGTGSYAAALKKNLEEGANEDSATSSASSTKATAMPSSSYPPLPSGLAPPSSSSAPYPIPSGVAHPSGSTGAILPSGSISSHTGTAPYTKTIGTAPFTFKTGTAPHTFKTGTAPYLSMTGTAPYSSKTGTAPYSFKTGTAAHSSKTGTAPQSFKTGTAPYQSKTGTAPHSYQTGIAPSGSAATVPSGASSGYFPGASASSNAPYPVSNSSSSVSSNATSSPSISGENIDLMTGVATTTYQVVLVTPVSYPSGASSSSSPVNSGSGNGAESLSSAAISPSSSGHGIGIENSSLISSLPTNTDHGNGLGSSSLTGSPSGTQEVLTTKYISTYLTTCPVTQTVTSGGSQIIQTGSTVSTVYSTITSTICTKCVAPPTPAPTHAASSPVSQSEGPNGPVSSGSTQDVFTTVFEYTTLTTCPVTNIITSGTSEIVQVTQSVSTIIRTTTSTICTKCVAPATFAPATGAPGVQAPEITGMPGHQSPPMPVPAGNTPGNSPAGSSSGGSSPAGSPPGNSPLEAGSSSGGSSPAASSPAGNSQPGSGSPSHQLGNGAQGGNSSPSSESSESSPESSKSGSPAGGSSNGQTSTPNAPGFHSSTPAENSPANSQSQNGAQGNSQPGAPAQVSEASSASAANSGPVTVLSTLNLVPIQTLTIVPLPLNPSQTAKPTSSVESETPGNGPPGNGASSGGAPGSAVLFPASNGTTPASSTNSTSPSQSTGSATPSTALAFTGAASKMGTGAFGLVAFVVAAVLL